jgi:cobalt-precorrin-5B (C1)-methyltransferase
MARFLKYGITTGATAAAAAKAAVTALVSNPVDKVVIPTPIGIRFEIPVKETKKLSEDSAIATAVKDAGDDVDVTDEIEIHATVKLTDDGEVTVKSGKGVGTVTKPGLAVSVGEPAINPIPKKMIIEAVKEALPKGKGAEVVIDIPEGEAVAKKTLNAKLGILGGISVLGTTGVVKPFSMEAWKRSMVPQIDVALAKGYKRIFVVPGNIGEKITKQLFKASDEEIIQTGDFMGYMLDQAVEKGVKEIMLLGHPGKLVKLAAGIFNTHHKMGDARAEVVAAYAGAAGADTDTVNRILQSNTTEEAAEILKKIDLSRATFDRIAEKVRLRVMDRIKEKAKVSVIIVSYDGTVLGADESARRAEPWLNST